MNYEDVSSESAVKERKGGKDKVARRTKEERSAGGGVGNRTRHIGSPLSRNKIPLSRITMYRLHHIAFTS